MTDTKRVRVRVTEEDIREGVAEACRECPIALAVRRECNPKVDVSVMRKVAISMIPHPVYQHRLSTAATNFMVKFDASKPVSPIEFDMNLPVWALKEDAT
jgi:hypothetical protein